ncbi:alpha-galactosidase [Rhodobacteraceae bacterium CCMM004]|nr:alpha-galactosidase [Rhodobacteraceae bacterium CCMM004]
MADPQCWRIDDGVQTLVLAVRGGGMAEAVYWGAPLPGDEDLTALVAAAAYDLTGGSLDRVAPLSLCPEASAAFPGQPGLAVAAADGTPLNPAFRFVRAETAHAGLRLHFADADLGLAYVAHILADAENGVLRLTAELTAEAPVRLDWFSAPVLPAPQDSDGIVDFHGTWLREFSRTLTQWSPGIRLREARTGRSGHEHPPFALCPGRGAGRTHGDVWAWHLGWSGGHRMAVEELPDGRRQVQMGMARGSERAPGTCFATPPLYAAFSSSGEAGVARCFQRHLRDRVVRWPQPRRPRPVHYNCWEAVYFDHDPAALADIAARAAALGAERFVLDDGWFGRRDDDTTSLGDWQVDRRKWPDGLGPFIAQVQDLGMTFGLWVEPEMVSRDSDLARAHPDWILGRADQTTGRGQHVLDMAREDVRDHLFTALDTLLGENDIDYLKWDHNRTLPAVDAAQTRGTYALIDRLRAAHPGVEIESCASGGGRIDAGILERTQRVWLSDSNDALERLRIQHEAATFLPAAIVGSHVGPRRCHTSGRILPMAFRAWVAAQRHFGMEMDPRELTEAEAAVLTRICTWWKETRDWRMAGDTVPLDSADPAVVAEMQIARDGRRFILFAGQAATPVQTLPRPLCLAALDPESRYRLTLVNPEDLPPQSRGPLAFKDGPVTLSGQALMRAGLLLPWAWPATMWVIEGTRL